MKVSYFKLRKRFDFSPHPYDIGNAFGPWKRNADSHFLLKIYKLDRDKFEEYYNYHLQHTIDNHIADDKEFFAEVWQLINDRISYFRNKSPFDANHQHHLNNVAKLQQFKVFLEGIDKWNARPSHIIIDEKERTIYSLKAEVEDLKAELTKLREYEVSLKVMIADGYLPTFIDLIQQMRELKVNDTRALLRSDHKIPFAKMISKYFSHGEKDIPIETARNYFVDKKGDIPIKGTSIQSEQQLFKIVPLKPTKK